MALDVVKQFLGLDCVIHADYGHYRSAGCVAAHRCAFCIQKLSAGVHR